MGGDPGYFSSSSTVTAITSSEMSKFAKGVHSKIVQEMLGHSSITITLDLYSHVLPDMQEKAVEAMDDIFDG